ncbi:MAG TPA: hypothetical protein VIF09_22595 [Polyangiaceae bacterium]
MPSAPAPAALWLLQRGGKPTFDAAALAAALGDDARVTATDPALSVSLGAHTLRAVPLGAPLPKAILEQCLPVAHLLPEQKAELAAHTAHALVVLDGDGSPGVDGLVALYRTAWALHDDDTVGLINPVSWMCLTTQMLGETMTPEFLHAVRASPAESLALWLGFVKLFKPDGSTWLVTRGGWLVGLPDLAWLAKDLEETDDVYSMFASVLDYAFTSGTRLAAGHTVDFSERPLKIREPYEYVDYIGPETLVLEPREVAGPTA